LWGLRKGQQRKGKGQHRKYGKKDNAVTDGFDHFTMMMQGEYIANNVERLLKTEPAKKSRKKKTEEVADKKE